MAVLPTPGLADEHGIVLGAPRQHLNDAPDFLIAPDHRVELAFARDVGQVASVAFERLVLAFGIRIGDPLRSAHGGQRLEDRVLRDAVPGEELRGRGAARL